MVITCQIFSIYHIAISVRIKSCQGVSVHYAIDEGQATNRTCENAIPCPPTSDLIYFSIDAVKSEV